MNRRSMTAITGAALAGAGLMTAVPTAATAGPNSPVAAGTALPADPATPTRSIRVRWDWSMPPTMVDRTHIDPTTLQPVPGPDGIPDRPLKTVPGYAAAGHARYGPLPADGRYSVTLDASRSRGTGVLMCDWVIHSKPRVKRTGKPCSQPFNVALPEGTFALTLRLSDRAGHRTVHDRITVKNVLMSIMGDSYASGEGFPPFRSRQNGTTVIDWDEPACQRSRWSGFVRSALALEKADPRSNVTLLDVACAGAEIKQSQRVGVSPSGGLLSPQQKFVANGVPGSYMPPQIDQLRAIAGRRAWDVTLLSIGGNDVGLSPIVKTCLLGDVIRQRGNCYMEPVIGTQSAPLFQVVDHSLAVLEQRFESLAPCVGAKGGHRQCRTVKIVNNAPAADPTNSKPIVISDMRKMLQAMYPDLTHQPNGQGGVAPCTLTNPPQTPLNPIDNVWAYGTLFVGRPGRPVHLPTTFPQYERPDPNPVVPTAKGLVPMLRDNRSWYGWRLGLTMFKNSHPHGVCAPGTWVYGLTDALQQGVSNLYGVLHPNDTGQAQYARMLRPVTRKMAGIPVRH